MSKIFILALVAMPILFQYSIKVATVTLGDLCLAISLFVIIFKLYKKIKIDYSFCCLFCFLICELIYSLIIGIYASLGTTLRYAFYIFVIIFIPTIAKECKFVLHSYVVLAMLSSFLLILQYICIHMFNIYIPGVIKFLPLTDTTLIDYGLTLNSQVYKRVMSCFGEPSHFAIYVLGALIILLFSANLTKKSMLKASFITLAIFLSTSITGVLLVIFIWILFIKKQVKLQFNNLLLISMLFFMIFIPYFKSQSASYVRDPAIFIRQMMGRIPGYEYVLDDFRNDKLQYLLGHGMHDIGERVYLAGYPRLFYYYGITGSFIFVICYVFLYKRKNEIGNYILLSISILSIGTEMIFGPLLLPYVTVILTTKHFKDCYKLLHP